MTEFSGTLDDGRLDVPRARRAGELLVAGADPPGIAEAWRRWGTELAAHVQETFLVWDPAMRRGVLARGRSGADPLLLGEASGRLAFAPDPGPLLDLLRARPDVDRSAVAGWLVNGAPPPGRTLLAGVRRLPPGRHLLLSASGWTERTHWRPNYTEPLRDQAEAREALADALRAAVRAAADPRAALLLSGGLDSTIVAALSPPPGPLALHAGFPGDTQVDESALVDATVAELGLQGARALGGAARPIEYAAVHTLRWQAPQGSPNEVLWAALLGWARERGARVVLDGEGGDSVLGPAPFVLADHVRALRPFAARRAAEALVGDQLAWRAVWRYGAIGALPAGPHQAWRRLRGAARLAPSWLRPEAAAWLAEADQPWAWKRLDGPRWWAERAHDLVDVLDASGAHDLPRRRAADAGMVARHPLQDPALIELVLRLDPALSHDPDRDRPLARDALARTLPEHVRARTVKAFFNPVQERWLVASRDAIAALLEPGALVGEFVRLDDVRAWALGDPASHPRGRTRWPQDTWRIVAMELWLRAHEDPGRIRPLAASGSCDRGAVRLVALG